MADDKGIPSPYESIRESTPAVNPAEEQAKSDYNREVNEKGGDPIPDKAPDWAKIPDAGKKKTTGLPLC
jgi:hypothetical protein